jgi:hypothetical protein
LKEIQAPGGLLDRDGACWTVPCDYVVIAKGYHSNNALARELDFLKDKLVIVGDAVRASDALEASSSGFAAGYYA